MKTLVVVLLLTLGATYAHAEVRKFENPYGTIRLTDELCAVDAAKALGKDAKAAKGTFTQVAVTPYGRFPMGQIDMAGCWVLVPGESKYRTLWEDGEEVIFDFADFQPEAL
jgi:hypothetical protein